MTDAPVPCFWLSRPDAAPPPRGWRALSDTLYREAPLRAPDRRPLLGTAPEWAEDLQRVARAVFAADRSTRRDRTFDHWTRHIHLSVPVTDTAAWSCALSSLLPLLSTLTGDRWDVEFRPLDTARQPQNHPLPFNTEDHASEVALFSGGLDSLGWAAERAQVRCSRALLFVSFQEPNFEPLQHSVYQAVYARRQRGVRRIELSQRVRKPRNSNSPTERSTRSRGLLYVASAVHAAAAEGVPVVRLPENGQLALNPPLSAGRAGSCSTRSVHPWTLHHLNQMIAMITGSSQKAVRIENPFASLTKGEVCVRARDAGMAKETVEATLSCGSPPARHPGQPARLGHCGVCFPCLVRRSGLRHAFGEDHTPYAANPWDLDPRSEGAQHWRALRRWLEIPLSALDILADTPLPNDACPATLLDVVERGRGELRSLVASAPNGT